MRHENVAVVVVGAGPAGLLLAQLLDRSGVDCLVLEARSREYVENRTRAGLLEQHTVDVLRAAGVADRLERNAIRHGGVEFRFAGRRHRVPTDELVGEPTWIYGQQEIVKDLIAARVASGGRLHFGVEDVRLSGLVERPRVHCTVDGTEVEITADYLAGCDGSHGVTRRSLPDGAVSVLEQSYPFAWLGILAQARPCGTELIYAPHERGFALLSMRSPTVTRAYLQVDADDEVGNWPDERIWQELRRRLEAIDAAPVAEGPIIDRGITRMRGVVVDPVRVGRTFLAGDAAHIVPPSAAKGLNLAVADAESLAEALAARYRDGREDLLASYSDDCLRRAWTAQAFSASMTELLHRFPGRTEFQAGVQRAQLRRLVDSDAAARSFAEEYTGRSRRPLLI
ncbi:4-hydroxybenzoate 3-monooxygenase [Nocardia mexicana]|uniref:p-hydroxybenzoate 3-monooxygenase n=1 Tax=Nocardia mexicana TaxID=279262 RepID=A0A370H1V1_9NOCA|nr:4-hydroxybenzoate 3-monooxygenase [Nocardia mexicana]RDI49990.1 p-hydroxybenzoate 3-monooxygenase [Nocardia mexicana]